MVKRLVSFLLFFFLLSQVTATHIAGGEVFYSYVGLGTATGTSRYQVTLKLYKECNSQGQSLETETVTLGIYNSGETNQLGLVRTLSMTGGAIRTIRNDQGANPCLSPFVEICYQIKEFTAQVDLVDNSSGYTLLWDRYTRTDLSNTSPASGLGATFLTKIPGTAALPSGHNSSPKFSENDATLICKSTPFTFDYSVTDQVIGTASPDSIAYKFAPAYDGFGGSASNPNPMGTGIDPYFLNPINYSTPYTGNFPLGPLVTINPQTGLISGTSPANTGKYVICVVAEEWRNGLLINTHRKDFIINIANCSLNGAQLSPDVWSCDGFTWTFENQSSNANIISYLWNFGDGSTSTDPRPTHTYADTGIYTVTLRVTSTGGCQDQATQRMHVFPGFFPGFTSNGSCKGIPFQFTDTTLSRYSQVNYWRWNFGDPATLADTSTAPAPQYTYPSVGTYNVQMIVRNQKGCIDTAYADVVVNDKPVLTLPFKDTLICSIDTLQLHAISGSGQGTFAWTPNYRISDVTSSDPLVNPLMTTTYSVTLTDRGCVATDNIKVNVLDFITVDAGPDTTICRTDSVTLRPVSQALSYQWTPTATLNNPNTKFPVALPTAASTTYYVRANLGKCQAGDSIIVKTVPYPKANAGNDTTICFGDAATLNGSIDGVSSIWLPSQLVTNANSLITTVRPRTTTTFILVVTDTLGCPKPFRDSVLVTVRAQPLVFAGNDTTVIIGQPLVFQPVVSPFLTSFLWSPATGLNRDTLLRPTATISASLFPASGQLTYTLTASSPEGCNASDAFVVRIFKTPPSIFVPSAFTPNGDGNNDIFKPIMAGIQRLDFFRVYNRLGQVVFSTSTIGKGWDGYVNGNPQGSAGYVYTVQAVDYMGNVLKQSGSFVLIR